MTMIDLFASPKSMLSRAKHHIADLTASLNRVTRAKPWAYDVDRDVDGVTEVHKIKISERFQDDLPCIVFDAINNLRACLDQTSYATSAANGHPDSTFTYFPIVKGQQFIANALNSLKTVHPDIRAFFAGFKPYKGGNDTLWALNELANTKKHVRLVPINLGKLTLTFPAAIGTATIEAPLKIVDLGSSYDAEKNEIILGRLPPNADRGTNSQITFAIVFDHPDQIINGQKPVPFLNAMSREVERVLVGTEAECQRIGLIK